MKIKLFKFLAVLCIGISPAAYCEDFEAQFNANSKKNKLILERSEKIKEEATFIKCNYDEGWGKVLYRMKNDLYKNSSNNHQHILKVASINNGRFEWKETFGEDANAIEIKWQLIQKNESNYKIFMKSKFMDVIQFDCIVK